MELHKSSNLFFSTKTRGMQPNGKGDFINTCRQNFPCVSIIKAIGVDGFSWNCQKANHLGQFLLPVRIAKFSTSFLITLRIGENSQKIFIEEQNEMTFIDLDSDDPLGKASFYNVNSAVGYGCPNMLEDVKVMDAYCGLPIYLFSEVFGFSTFYILHF